MNTSSDEAVGVSVMTDTVGGFRLGWETKLCTIPGFAGGALVDIGVKW